MTLNMWNLNAIKNYFLAQAHRALQNDTTHVKFECNKKNYFLAQAHRALQNDTKYVKFECNKKNYFLAQAHRALQNDTKYVKFECNIDKDRQAEINYGRYRRESKCLQLR